jgi:hypothetical protein
MPFDKINPPSNGGEARLGYERSHALRTLIGEALAVCRAIDPRLEETFANLLDVCAIEAPSDGVRKDDQISCLLVARRMFIYAHAEAQTDQTSLAEKLELCIACLAERVEALTQPRDMRPLPA